MYVHHARWLTLVITASFYVSSSSECRADGEGILIQAVGDQLVLGFDNDTPGGLSIGARVFSDLLPPTGISTDPSFLSVAAAPAGTASLPPGLDVHWDFLPLTIDGVTANLFHWDGQGEIGFSPAQSASLSLFAVGNTASTTVDGTAEAVPGLRIGTTTSSALSLHAHRFWRLAGSAGDPADGIYTAALRIRADGFAPTEPLVVGFSTFGTAATLLLDQAVPWLEDNLNDLFLTGDYNFDGQVDNDDYGVWALQFGGATPQPVDIGEANGNGDREISAADFTIWRDAATNPAAASLNAATVPEPTAFAVLLSTLGLVTAARRRHER